MSLVRAYLDPEQERWLRSHFDSTEQGPASDSWGLASMLGVALEALQQTPEAVTLMCKLRDAYNEEADRHAAMAALRGPRVHVRCDGSRGGPAPCGPTNRLMDLADVEAGAKCPLCRVGKLSPIP